MRHMAFLFNVVATFGFILVSKRTVCTKGRYFIKESGGIETSTEFRAESTLLGTVAG
jgi:hypothetical protein